jgi:hypothetical protein
MQQQQRQRINERQQQATINLKKGLWLGSQGGGATEGEETNPMQEERITTVMTND